MRETLALALASLAGGEAVVPSAAKASEPMRDSAACRRRRKSIIPISLDGNMTPEPWRQPFCRGYRLARKYQ
jgi:hypothetical protein